MALYMQAMIMETIGILLLVLIVRKVGKRFLVVLAGST